jgi:hypothetical protein
LRGIGVVSTKPLLIGMSRHSGVTTCFMNARGGLMHLSRREVL